MLFAVGSVPLLLPPSPTVLAGFACGECLSGARNRMAVRREAAGFIDILIGPSRPYVASHEMGHVLINMYSYWELPAYGQEPLKAWARQQVFDLSKADPALVAETVFKTDLKRDLKVDSSTFTPLCAPFGRKEYRRFVSQFLSEEARVALAKLEEKTERQRKTSR